MEEDRGDPTATNHAVERPCLPDPILLTIRDAARMLSLGQTTVYELIGAGALEVVHVGPSVRVPVDAVHSFFQSRRAARWTSTVRRHFPLLPAAGVALHAVLTG